MKPNKPTSMLQCLLALTGCVGSLAAQFSLPPGATGPMTYVKQWGRYAYDSRAQELPVRAVACGSIWTGRLRSDGRLFIQGQGAGPGVVPPAFVPEVPELPPGTTYSSVSISNFGAMAIRSDGEALGWGWLFYTAGPPAAPSLPPGLRYERVALGASHGLLLRSDGQIVTLGSNNHGETTVPPLPSGVPVAELQAAPRRSAILLVDGRVVLFGDNQLGQLTVPALPPGLTYTAMACKSYEFTMLLRSDGRIEAFGNNSHGQCNVPPLPPGLRYERIATGNVWSAAVRSDQVVLTWGGGGALAYGLATPPVIPPGLRCIGMDAGDNHLVILLSDGTVRSVGHNGFYEHDMSWRSTGSRGARRMHVDLSSGVEHSLVVYDDGSMEAFGLNHFGQCDVPPLPPGLRYVRGGAGGLTSLALRSDGSIVGFGTNAFGGLNVPPLPAGLRYVDLAVTHGHAAVLRSDGQVFAFGDNSAGQCVIPALPQGARYEKVAVHDNHTVLLRSDGVIIALGAPYGGPVSPSPLPTPAAGTRFVDVAAARNFAIALQSDGRYVGWGVLTSSWQGGWHTPPPLPAGIYYVQVHGNEHCAVLRRSDGRVDVLGNTSFRMHMVPEAEPGASILQVSGLNVSAAARYGPTCIYQRFAAGCAGSMPAPQLVPVDTPRIGRDHDVRIRNAPVHVAVLAMGFGRPPSPVSLAAAGMPGCTLAVDVDAAVVVSGQSPEVMFRLPIPDSSLLVGLAFYQHALVLDPNAGNPLGAVMSEAMLGVVGYP
jgi:alpha-tubulin suppressor-like RCC1 family protein